MTQIHWAILIIAFILLPTLLIFGFLLLNWALETEENKNQVKDRWTYFIYTNDDMPRIASFNLLWIGLIIATGILYFLYNSIKDDTILLTIVAIPCTFILSCLSLRWARKIYRKQVSLFVKLKNK